MKQKITLNKKEIVIPEFTFNTMIDLEERGVSLAELQSTPMKFIRAIIALSLNVSNDEAGNEIQKHIENGGKLDEVINSVTTSISESGFIKALQDE